MVDCARCGAVNKAGRASCWNCLAPLPQAAAPPVTPEPVVSPTPLDPPPASLPHSYRTPLEPLAPVTCEETCPPARRRGGDADNRTFAYVGTPVAVASQRGLSWVMVTVLLITVMLLAAVLFWFFTFPRTPRAASALDIATAYLTAVKTFDIGTQQRLSTEDSKSAFLPPWLSILDAQPAGAVSMQADRAELPIDMMMAYTSANEQAPSESVRNALARPYRLLLQLEHTSQGWRVDQAAFFHTVRQTLAIKNPTVVFPPWE